MHNSSLEKYYFINSLDTNVIKKLQKHTTLIYRNYNEDRLDEIKILKLKSICKKNQIRFVLSNQFKLSIKLNLDGAYIPSFNNEYKHLSYNLPKDFVLIGSAHNLKEILIKQTQNVDLIFISPIYKTKKKKFFLDTYRFINLKKLTRKKVIALGGINYSNFKKLRFTDCYGIASISSIKSYYNGKSN